MDERACGFVRSPAAGLRSRWSEVCGAARSLIFSSQDRLTRLLRNHIWQNPAPRRNKKRKKGSVAVPGFRTGDLPAGAKRIPNRWSP